MKRREFMAAFAAAFAVVSCGESNPAGTSPPAPPPPPPPPPPAAVPGANVTVFVEDNAFRDPDDNTNQNALVEINSGETVGWRHTGANPHTVTSTTVPGGAQAFDSGTMGNDDTFSVTLTVTGMYIYRCETHPGIMFDSRVRVV